jgi:hypothetical protein
VEGTVTGAFREPELELEPEAAEVVGVVAEVVSCEAAPAAVDGVWVAEAVAPGNALAATTEKAPVRARPPPTAHRLSLRTRCSPASRRALGSVVMGRSLATAREIPLGTT